MALWELRWGIVGAQVRYMYYLPLLLFYLIVHTTLWVLKFYSKENGGIEKNTLYQVTVFEMVHDLWVEMYVYINDMQYGGKNIIISYISMFIMCV